MWVICLRYVVAVVISLTLTLTAFFDEIEVMNSMAKPKKMSILGSNGQVFTFLGKKDDLRKDGRLMDFDFILNKLLKSDSEARRRKLRE